VSLPIQKSAAMVKSFMALLFLGVYR